MGSLRPGSRFFSQDPLGIPCGSHPDPRTYSDTRLPFSRLLRQPAALVGDELLHSLEKRPAQALDI